MINETTYAQQLEREQECETAGLNKFLKSEDKNNRAGNASHNSFALQVKKVMLGEIIEEVKKTTEKVVGYNASEVASILQRCIKAKANGEFVSYFNIEEATFLGLQLTLDTALNPNKIDSKEISRYGGDKNCTPR